MGELPKIDVLVATYNSAATLGAALGSVRSLIPVNRLVVVDHHSDDATPRIAREAGAELYEETTGLGRARNLALEMAETDPVLFVDSDVILVRPDFYALALREYRRPHTAAVVGTSVGHPFAYGLPLGLTLVGRRWALDAQIPDQALGRETYYLQRAARVGRARVRYVRESMVHLGTYRSDPHWPEFQGAAVRLSSGWNPREIAYSALVAALVMSNSRRARNVAYTPVFCLKLARGFLDPRRWARLARTHPAGG